MPGMRSAVSCAAIPMLLASFGVLLGCGASRDENTGAAGATSESAASVATATSTATTSVDSSASSSGSTGSGPPPFFDCRPADGSPVSLGRINIVTGLTAPLLVKSAPDDPDRLYVVQQSGQVLIYENGALLPMPFIDIADLVDYDNVEQGLLGLAFHPGYAQNGRFFLHYSDAQGAHDSTVQEFRRSAGDMHVAEHDPVELVLREPTQIATHNGGAVEFGPDGYLYIALGDGGGHGDPECDAQNTMNLLGKIVRLDVDARPTAEGYPPAPGNPDGAKYFHIGLRNPWRLSFDGCTGDLFIGDVGQNAFEEMNHLTAGAGPQNFGWPYREGANDFATPLTCPPKPAGLYEPFFDYDHTVGCAMIGGYVYRSTQIPGLRGAYLFGDYCNGWIWTAVADGLGGFVVTRQDAISGGNVVSFGQDGRGNIYMLGLQGIVDELVAN